MPRASKGTPRRQTLSERGRRSSRSSLGLHATRSISRHLRLPVLHSRLCQLQRRQLLGHQKPQDRRDCRPHFFPANRSLECDHRNRQHHVFALAPKDCGRERSMVPLSSTSFRLRLPETGVEVQRSQRAIAAGSSAIRARV